MNRSLLTLVCTLLAFWAVALEAETPQVIDSATTKDELEFSDSAYFDSNEDHYNESFLESIKRKYDEQINGTGRYAIWATWISILFAFVLVVVVLQCLLDYVPDEWQNQGRMKHTTFMTKYYVFKYIIPWTTPPEITIIIMESAVPHNQMMSSPCTNFG
eukprot:48686_1